MIGDRIGPYSVLAKLGEGGMGEVYRARDTTLDRDVAIKILPASFASDPDRLLRFEREAKTLASLNHPHIAQVFGVERQSSTRAIVMELVEGETLADRIARGPFPVDEALPIARQIADALAAAHDAGIVHRDLKPANIKIRPDGVVKVLDFGLAKAMEQGLTGSTPHSLENSPTITSPMTAAGTILGTAAYMSPEQARGRLVDRRADSWAFGCVLYEMLTGRRAFDGQTVSDVLAAIMRDTPSFDSLPPDVPAPIRRLLRRCLEKDRARRLDSMRDACLDIDEGSEPGPHLVGSAVSGTRRRMPPWLIAVMLAAIPMLIGLGYMAGRRPEVAAAPFRAEVGVEPAAGLGPAPLFGRPSRHALVLTSDGRTIVFVGTSGATQRMLYARPLDASEARAIPGTESAQTPFLSPDDRWVGFLADGAIRKVPLAGGPVVTIADLKATDANSPSALVGLGTDFFGASWGEGGAIVFGRYRDGLWQVPAEGGTPSRLTTTKTGSHRNPRHLPGDRGLLLTMVASDTSIGVLPRGATEPRTLIERAVDARYAGSSHLVFSRDGVLMATAFDVDRLEVMGSPFPVEPSVMVAAGSGSPAANSLAAHFDVSRSGLLVFATGGLYPPRPSRLVWVDRSGQIEPIYTSTGDLARPRLSPDGRRIAFALGTTTVAEASGVYTIDLERGSVTPVTKSNEWSPLWSPDGSHIMFVQPGSDRTVGDGSAAGMGRIAADGSGRIEDLLNATGYPHSVTRDGVLLFGQLGGPSGADIWTMQPDGDRTPKPLLNTPANEAWAELSPDGRWIAYGSDSSGRFEVYVQPFPRLGPRQQISTAGGDSPLWSRNGRELFYLSVRDGRVFVNAVDVSGTDTLTFGKPRELFSGQFGRTGSPTAYDVSLDGKRFLITEWLDAPAQPVTRLRVVFNWFEELRRAERLSK